jgi:hypothetical protein
MHKEMNEFLRLTYIQMLCDEWAYVCPKLQATKSIEEAYEIYQDYELRIFNLNRYIELRIKHGMELEDGAE